MGTLRTTITLEDKVSQKLKTINRNIDKTIKTMARMNQVMSGLDGGSMGKAMQSWSNTAKNAVNSVLSTQKAAQKMAYDHQKSLDRRLEIQAKGRAATEKALAIEKQKLESKITLEKQKQLHWQDRFNASLQRQQMQYEGIFGYLRLWGSRLRNILTMYYAIRGVAQFIGNGVKLSDKMTMTDAKFNLVAGGDKQLAGDLKEKTFYAAQRSTTDYLEFGKAVGKLGILAGDKFANNDSIVKFVELMNKSFQISGAETSERNAAMLQITQAIASNRLQGDEFRSILENAPLVMDALNRSLGVTQAELKKMAKEGEITADVLIKAMFDAESKIETMYTQLDMTWERHWAKIKNVGVLAFEPIHEQLKKLFNSKQFQSFVDGLCTAMIVLGNLGGKALEWLASGFNKVVEFGKQLSGVFTFLRDVIVAVTIAVGLYGIVWAIVNWETTTFILGTSLLIGLLIKFPQILLAIVGVLWLVQTVWWLVTKATQTASVWSAIWQFITMNAAWIIIGVIALVIFWVYKCSDSWADAIGKIVGVVMQAVAVIWNIIYGVITAIFEFFLRFVNNFIDGWEFALNCVNGGFDNFGEACKNLIGQIISWFLSLGKVVTTIIDAIFGTNWTAGLSSLQENVLSWGKNKKAITLKRYTAQELLGNVGVKRWAYSDAYDFGYDKGSGVVNNISKGLGNIGSKLDDLTKVDLNGQKLTADALNGLGDKLGDVGSNTGNTAKNTGDIAKNTSSSKDYSYLRDWYWNKGLGNSIGYNIKIEQNNRNNVASGLDLDKIADALIDKFMEGLNIGKEGAKI